MSGPTAKDKRDALARAEKVLKIQRMLIRLGYMTSVDTRMGLYRLHVWSLLGNVSIANIEQLFRKRKIKATVKKHPELGVWVGL